MNPDELPAYVALKRKEGLSDNTIRTILLSAGYSQHDTEVAVAAGTVPPPAGTNAPATNPQPTVVPNVEPVFHQPIQQPQQPSGGNVPLTSTTPQAQPSRGSWRPFFPEIFKMYRTRFWTLLGAAVIAVLMPFSVGIAIVLITIPATFAFAISPILGVALLFAVVVAGGVGEIWLGSAGGIAVLNIALHYEEGVGIGESLKLGFKKAWLYFGTMALMALILMGAFFLLIVPGIFLSIAFCLTAVVFLAENQRFSDAFLRSRDLVKGHWWYVFGCMLAVVIVPEIVIAVIEKVGGTVIGGILGLILIVLMIPLYISVPVVMFRNLQSLKPVIEPSSNKRRWKYKLFILPFVVILLALAIFFPFIFSKLSSIKFTGGATSSSTMENPFSGMGGDLMASSRDERRVSDLRELKVLTSLYADTGDFSVCKANTLYASAPIVPPDGWQLGPNAGVTSTDGTGWLPFDMSDITSELPVDPTNDPSQGLVYVMACNPVNKTFKFEAKMENAAYNQGGPNDVTSVDGGIDPNLYEVGTDLSIVIPKFEPPTLSQ